MLAKDAIDGAVYRLPARGQEPAYSNAVCNGWNYSNQWLLFLVSDSLGKRKVTLVLPTQEIQAVN